MTEERTWPPADVELFDAGHGVFWSKYVDSTEAWIGILHWHYCQDPERLTPNGIHFDTAQHLPPEYPRWTVVNPEPAALTLSPSVLCRTCGAHGYFTNGQWVPV